MIGADATRALEQALGDAVAFDVSMQRHTSLRIGGPAEALATPPDRDALAALLGICTAHAIPVVYLGAGFNTLVSDAGIEGVVIKLSKLRGLSKTDATHVRAEAGVTHASLTRFCARLGLSGLEFGCGIPGQIGGWVAMNAGIGTHEVCDVLAELEVMRPDGSGVDVSARKDLDFTYRALRGLPAGSAVLAASFNVHPARTEEITAEMDALLERRAQTQPLQIPSCGSVWKNPEGDFAGRLIEAAGLKGAREGGAEITEIHANFIANTGGATEADVRRLMARVSGEVERQSGVRLEPEVRFVGRGASDVVPGIPEATG